MGVKMMRWRPWPPLTVRKFDVKLLVHRLIGGGVGGGGAAAAEVRWKGGKTGGLGSTLRRNAAATRRRDFTAEVVQEEGELEWEEEFQCVCNLSAYGGNGGELIPWEIGFTVLINNSFGGKQGAKTKPVALGPASLNIAEYADRDEEKEFELNIPLNMSGSNAETQPLLNVTLSISEVKPAQDNAESTQKSIAPVVSPPLSGETSSSEKDELSALQAGLRKVKILTEFVASRRLKKAFRAEGSSRSDDGDCMFSFDSDSLDEFEEGDTDEGKEDFTVRKSYSYGTLAYANAGGSFVSSARINADDEDWVYYSNRRRSDVGCSVAEDSSASVAELPPVQYSRRSILPWRKRKLSFRSPKTKGEPLLKKAYGEEGGDDIDFDRRQLSSDESTYGWHKSDEDSSANQLIASEFGDDSFAVGSWEPKEIISRDGYLKLETKVFFASIDQRSERAAGESACTALVAVLADWLHTNRDIMPIKSQFDSLIRDGSLEWRRLCENETYMERFPDKHFDLETVLQAKIRQLSVDPGKSFIGFFHPDGIDEDRFDFLQGAMSLDGVWDEISSVESNHTDVEQPHIYIVSWNDHFFVLKVEKEAYYIIDTLGERLFEGCNQAYILKFDKSTKISKLPVPAQSPGRKALAAENETVALATAQPSSDVEPEGEEETEEVICQGRESCKEYMKSFLAAIPIRELLVDLKKGLMASTPLHHRLQIEFHYTQFLSSTGTEANIVQDRSMEIPITDISE